VAEPKREEEKVIPIDGVRGERQSDSPQASEDPTSAEPPAGDEASPASELQKLKAEKEELLQTMIRRQADFENFRKRTERDRHEEGRRGVERLILDLIPVLDAFDRALQAHDEPGYEEYRKGVTLIRKQLWDSIAKHGVQRIEAAGNPTSMRMDLSSRYFRTATRFTGAFCGPRLCALPCIPEKAGTPPQMKIRPTRRPSR
jgi:molecular chaperone GrpE